MKKSLFESLREYSKSDCYPFHMPGHKRNPAAGPMAELWQLDITEIDGFDNLHAPEGILKEAQEYAAGLYHSEETYFLINGSTAGILSAVSAAAGSGNRTAKKLIIARNCHKAVYHAAFLNHLEIEYIYPDIIKEVTIADGISALQVEKKLQEIAEKEGTPVSGISGLVAGIVITSPTYDGILSDVAGIVQVSHRYGIPVIVDQAHGAHFGFHPGFPPGAVTQGADLVIHSVHKTLPSPTQTALLHRNGSLVSGEVLRQYLGIYQSSSPSYLLMAGIDACMHFMKQEGEKRLDLLLSRRTAFMRQAAKLKKITVYSSEDGKDGDYRWRPGQQEPGRLLISVKDASFTGKALYQMLREKYHLQMEMCTIHSVTAILSLMDEEEGFHRLAKALDEIDGMLLENACPFSDGAESLRRTGPQIAMRMEEAFLAEGRYLPLEEAEGEIAASFISLYPPGIPLLVPGEEIDRQMLSLLKDYLEKGFEIQGLLEGQRLKTVNICI